MAQRCKHTQMDRDATPSKAPKVGFQPRLSTFLGGHTTCGSTVQRSAPALEVSLPFCWAVGW